MQPEKVFSSAFEITLKSYLHFIQPNPGGVGLILPAISVHRSLFSGGRSPVGKVYFGFEARTNEPRHIPSSVVPAASYTQWQRHSKYGCCSKTSHQDTQRNK